MKVEQLMKNASRETLVFFKTCDTYTLQNKTTGRITCDKVCPFYKACRSLSYGENSYNKAIKEILTNG